MKNKLLLKNIRFSLKSKRLNNFFSLYAILYFIFWYYDILNKKYQHALCMRNIEKNLWGENFMQSMKRIFSHYVHYLHHSIGQKHVRCLLILAQIYLNFCNFFKQTLNFHFVVVLLNVLVSQDCVYIFTFCFVKQNNFFIIKIQFQAITEDRIEKHIFSI